MIHKLSASLLIIGPALVLLYDLYAALYGGEGATFTSIIKGWAAQWTELPWITAALMVWLWGHLFLNGIVARMAQEVTK